MSKIYLAAPYTNKDPIVVEYRVKQINCAAAQIMRDGHIVFSPISHSHYIAMQEDLPKTFEWWVKQNHAFIEWADVVMVLKIEGWNKSKGVTDEVGFALKSKKMVKFIDCPEML